MEKLLSPEEAGEVLGIGADAVRRLCSDGGLTHIRLGRKGGRLRIRPRDLEAWIDANEVPAIDRTNPTLAQIRERERERRNRQTA